MSKIITQPEETKTGFTDALIICAGEMTPSEIQNALENNKFTWQSMHFNTFLSKELDLENVGTAIIDTESTNGFLDAEQMLEIIEMLDNKNIPTVLYGNTGNINTGYFKMLNIIEKQSVNQIISVIKISNIYRKRIVELENQKSIAAQNNHAQQLENQLKMAGAVQKDFLPQDLPNSDKFKWAVTFMPADWVSGDIYDITRIDEKHIGFYLADAVGHSMPAALLTMFLKQSIQMRQTTGNAYKIFSPLEVIQNLNQKMFSQHLKGCQFATCCYFLLNTETLMLEYCRAGHPYPILINGTNAPTPLQTTGSLLGIFEDAQFEQGSVQLQSGDKLIVYSDGAEPFMGTKLNKEALHFETEFKSFTTLPVKQLVSKFETLVKQSAEMEEKDDISLIALEIQ
ncbi:MAG: serine/threonine-protein phosphatase [Sedimentisphaerales bacterium]|nr:serine/threonine-protein phosphatase [Sedimentisphaerales bacterium]